MTDLPATFGKYFLTEKIAVGGMAEIYLAKLIGPSGFEKQLIIKQIHPQLSGHPQFVDLFVAEAKTLVTLTHGNIVPVYELGVVDDVYFIAMEYIDGPSLDALNSAIWDLDQVIEPRVAAYITAELLKGLDYAHRKGDGVIHRDLSPRNVMISRDGEVKLVDFGIAVTLHQQRSPDSPIAETDGTRPEGSYPYMSPEQVRREVLSGQSDLFSAGVLLWEMLTGGPLFMRPSAEETLQAVLNVPIAKPSSVRKGIPPELDEICLRALQRDPADRWPSASEFRSQINRYLYSLDEHVTPAKLSMLVAAYCPPSVRRAPTAAGTEPGEQSEPEIDPAQLLDKTKPIPRPGRGKPRAGTKTFATNVQFEDVLANATPMLRSRSRKDSAPDRVETAPARGSSPGGDASTTTTPSPGLARRIAPLVGLIAAALIAFGLWSLASRGSSGGSTAQPDAALTAANVADAAPPDATIPDAGEVADASPPDARRVHPPRRVDASPSTLATSTLKVGANPWGEVYLDGRKLGRAPGAWQVPVGKHEVVVKFPVPGREQSRTFNVVVEQGKPTTIGIVDFTAR